MITLIRYHNSKKELCGFRISNSPEEMATALQDQAAVRGMVQNETGHVPHGVVLGVIRNEESA